MEAEAVHAAYRWRNLRSLVVLWALPLLASLVLLALPCEAVGAPRHALVIANGDYRSAGRLRNPINDARAVSQKLKGLGFRVVVRENLSAASFGETLSEFLSGIGESDLVVFYYAGHGMQFKARNYLIGTEAQLKSEASLRFETYLLDDLIELFEKTGRTTLVFWDACRNNPLLDGFRNAIAGSSGRRSSEVASSVRSGPARVEVFSDTLVVFSASPGKEALDGEGEFSPFAEALLGHIEARDLEVEAMLKRVAQDVLIKTKGYQRPERLSQLMREFYFNRDAADDEAYERQIQQYRMQIAQGPSTSVVRGAVAEEPTAASTPSTPSAPAPVAPPEAGVAPSRPETAGEPAPLSEPSRRDRVIVAATKPATSVPAAGDRVTVGARAEVAAIPRVVRFARDGRHLAIAGDDGLIRIVRYPELSLARVLRASKDRIDDVDFSPDGKVLVAAGWDRRVTLWNVDDGRLVASFEGGKDRIYSVAFNPGMSGRYIAAGDRGGRLMAWDLKRRAKITDVRLHDGPVLALAYQPGGGGLFVTGSGDGTVNIRWPEGRRVSIDGHDAPVFDLKFAPDGSYFVTVSGDGEVKLWSGLPGVPTSTVLGRHLKYGLAAAVSPDSRRIASAGKDKAILVWDARERALKGRILGHLSDVEALAFSPDGAQLVSSSEDRSVRVWKEEGDRWIEVAKMYFMNGEDDFIGLVGREKYFGALLGGRMLQLNRFGQAVEPSEENREGLYIGPSLR